MNKTFIIAEAGVNHNGSLQLAKKLVDAAKRSGSDAIKFQTYKAEDLVSSSAGLANYQKNNVAQSIKSQLALIKSFELSYEDFRRLKKYCDQKRILFLSTPFDFQSADFLAQLRIPIFKIPSGEITNLPFIAHVAAKKKPVILSTGMSTVNEIKQAVKVIRRTGNKKLTLLHCVTEYPPPFNELNLRAIRTLKSVFKVPVGFSDHSLGIEASIAAVALGASVIEKHLTLDKKMKGPDHKASLNPQEFEALVKGIRNIEQALGDGIKKPTKSELKNLMIARKSLVVTKDLPKGQILSRNNIAIKRPGYGIQPGDIAKVIGRRVVRPIKKDSVLVWDHLK